MVRPILRVILDERIDNLDEKIHRVIFSAVEIPESVDIEKIKSNIDSVDFGVGDAKLHFTGMSQKNRDKIIHYISSLNIRVKIYVYYGFNQNQKLAKQKCLNWVINKTKKSMSKNKLEFMIERSEEYKDIIKTSNLINDDTLTIIPDAFCHVFARRLDIGKILYKTGCKDIDDKIYGLVECKKKTNLDSFNALKSQIRLEGYLCNNRGPKYYQREDKIQ